MWNDQDCTVMYVPPYSFSSTILLVLLRPLSRSRTSDEVWDSLWGEIEKKRKGKDGDIIYVCIESEKEREGDGKRWIERDRKREREKERKEEKKKRRKGKERRISNFLILSFRIFSPFNILFLYNFNLIFTFLVQYRIQFRFLGRIHPVSQENQDLGGKNPDPRQLFYLWLDQTSWR